MSKPTQVLGTVSVSPLNRDDLTFTNEKNLTYFYEPKPNNTIEDSPDWLPDKVTHTINSDSLNERFEYSPEKPPGIFRIITLGDSHTYGAFVETKESYPEQLEDILNEKLACKAITKFEVINLGFGGYDIEYALERFKTRGKKYHPDLVFWFVHTGDFSEIIDLMQPRIEFYRQKIEQESKWQFYYNQGIFYPHYRLASEELREQLGFEKIVEHQRSRLHEISDYYQGNLVMFAYPKIHYVYKTILRTFALARPHTYFFDRITQYDDIGEALPDGHPNAKAYSLISYDLFDFLTEEKIIPCD